jgi:hypothetical protein
MPEPASRAAPPGPSAGPARTLRSPRPFARGRTGSVAFVTHAGILDHDGDGERVAGERRDGGGPADRGLSERGKVSGPVPSTRSPQAPFGQ